MGRKPIIWTLELEKDSAGDLTDCLLKEGKSYVVADWNVRTHFMCDYRIDVASYNASLSSLNKTLKALKGTMNAKVIPVYAGILIDILNVRCYSEKKCFFFKDGQIVAHDLVKGVPRVSLKEYQVRLQKHLDHSKKHDGIILNDYNVTEECSEKPEAKKKADEYRIHINRDSTDKYKFTYSRNGGSETLFFRAIHTLKGITSSEDVKSAISNLVVFPEQYRSEVRKMLILALSYQTYADNKRYCFYEEAGEIKYHEQVPGTPYPSQQDIAKELDKLVKRSGKEGILLGSDKCTEKKEEKLPKITLKLAKASTDRKLFTSILHVGKWSWTESRRINGIYSETSFSKDASLDMYAHIREELKKYPYSVQKQVHEMISDYLNYFSYLTEGLHISYDSDFEFKMVQDDTISVKECKRLRERYKELTEASEKSVKGIQIYPKKG